MMERLMVRAQALGANAQRRRLEQIASSFRGRGFAAEVVTDSVICRGRNLLKQWVGDPLLRFAGRIGS